MSKRTDDKMTACLVEAAKLYDALQEVYELFEKSKQPGDIYISDGASDMRSAMDEIDAAMDIITARLSPEALAKWEKANDPL